MSSMTELTDDWMHENIQETDLRNRTRGQKKRNRNQQVARIMDPLLILGQYNSLLLVSVNGTSLCRQVENAKPKAKYSR